MSRPQLMVQDDGVVRLVGELSFDSVPALLEESRSLFDAGAEVVIDLGGVERTDSAGLALLVEWLRQAGARGRSLRFRNIPPQLLALAQVSDLSAILPLNAEADKPAG